MYGKETPSNFIHMTWAKCQGIQINLLFLVVQKDFGDEFLKSIISPNLEKNGGTKN